MTAYVLTLAAGVCLCFLFYALSLRRIGLRSAAAWLSLPLCILFGVVCAKLFYVLLLASSQFSRYGLAAFLRTEPRSFSVFGGCVGVIVGAVTGAKLAKVRPMAALDAFAPWGAALLALVRFCEGFLGTLGCGAFLADDSLFARFPFAVQNKYAEWYVAIFLLEGVAALAVALYLLLSRKPRPAGGRFEGCVTVLALCQIFCESLRSQGMMWGFVHVEQLLCAVLVFGLIAASCLQTARLPFLKRWWPCLAALGCIGLLVGAEFAKAKANSALLADWGWLLTAAVLAALYVISRYASRRRNFSRAAAGA